MEVRSFRRRDRRRRALGPRGLRHEGRRRRRGRRRLAVHRRAAVSGLDQLPHHRRRGRPGGQRHGQAPRLGARQGRKTSTIASSASRHASARSAIRSRTAGAARSTRVSPSTAARAMSPTRRSRRIRSVRSRRCLRRSSPRRSIRETPTFSRPTSKWSPSMSATRRRTSFPARSASASTSASTIDGRRIARSGDYAAGRGGGRGRPHDARLRADRRGRLPDQPGRSPISSPTLFKT